MQLLIPFKGENFSARTENFQCVESGINTGGTSDLGFYDCGRLEWGEVLRGSQFKNYSK